MGWILIGYECPARENYSEKDSNDIDPLFSFKLLCGLPHTTYRIKTLDTAIVMSSVGENYF